MSSLENENSKIELWHWSEEITKEAREAFGTEQVVCSGWSPSGIYHIGNFREAATCTGIRRQMDIMGLDTKFVFVVDDFDPLDKIPRFFKQYEDKLKPYLGHPLCRIPDPTGQEESYAELFAKGAREAFELFEMNAIIVKASELYAAGKYDSYLRLYYEKEDKVQAILEEVSGSRMNTFVSVVCEQCGSIGNTRVTQFDKENDLLHYTCVDNSYRKGCGHEGKIPVNSHEWKLKWRLDWPARQDFLGVTVEPAGKDHSVAGGSVDSAIVLHEKILQRKPPIMVRYGFITLRGEKLSGSSGTGEPAASAGKFMPASSFLFLVFKNDLLTDIQFNPKTLDVPKTVDEYDLARRYFLGLEKPSKERAGKKLATSVEIAMPENRRSVPPPRIKFMDLALVTQVCFGDRQEIMKRLRDRGIVTDSDSPEYVEEINERINHVEFWLERYAPQEARFSLLDEIPSEVKKEIDASILQLFVTALEEARDNNIEDAQELAGVLMNRIKSEGLSPRKAFPHFYRALIGKTGGPKATFLILVLGYDRVIDQLRKAL